MNVGVIATTVVVALALSALGESQIPKSCGPPASKAVEVGTVIRLTFGNGQTVKLTDVPRGDGQTDYRYRGYLSAIGYHLIELVLWGGPSTWYELYNACTGVKLVVDATPIISPDSTRFITLGQGVPRTPLVKRIQVWSRQPDGGFAVEWDFELSIGAKDQGALNWGPANARGLSATSVGSTG